MPIYKTATEIYDMLIHEPWETSPGKIVINMMGQSVTINDKSIIGYALQNWLAEYLKAHDIYFRVPANSQEFPDYFLSESDNDNLLELKTFDADRGAGFDIANFEAYCRSIETKPYRLNADYLVMSYTLRDGVLKIHKIWLKKIWELTCPSSAYPIKVQQKQNTIYNIRPGKWDSDGCKYKPFASMTDFVSALHRTMKIYPKTKDSAD